MEIKEFLLIKLLEGITSENHLEQSFVNQENKFYNVEGLKQANIDCLNSMSDRSTMLVIFVAFKENSGDFSPIKLFWAEGSKNDRGNITYVAKHKCDSAFVVQNFMKNFIVDLKSDFEQDVYLAKMEMSTKFLDQLEQDIMFFEPSITHGIAFSKNTHETNYRNMHPFAQTNEDCKRIFADANNELGISEFQIDRNSIIFSRAFRRMVDKAQIYTSSKGDHFRSRMTHTLEVCQIARAIGIKLNLNLDLIETIALAHDI
ncbi:HD domain-containing protein, partial [Desulfosporosinus metallidurans]|uniref:HD domain-containing protein n=1 Tax=Desulfosporosinus metallidurans TaxID=1888891 RepID=UPI000AD2B7D5